MSEEIKRCPFCGEEILAIAKKCKHCGSNLEEGASSVSAVIPRQAADYGMFLLAIPVISTLLVLFWVANMSLIQSPGSAMDMIMLATILGTAIVAAMEASSAGMMADRQKDTYSPTAWFFIITVLWVVGYPAYLSKRKHFGLANRLVAGILVALVFVVSWGLMYSVIESEKAKVLNGLEQMTKQFESLSEQRISVQPPQIEMPSPMANPAAEQLPIYTPSTLEREPVVTYSPCVEKEMARWQEQHDKEVGEYCADLAKEGQECRISAGQDARDKNDALEKITAQCDSK